MPLFGARNMDPELSTVDQPDTEMPLLEDVDVGTAKAAEVSPHPQDAGSPSLPELLPPKEAVPEHIDHDHNLARPRNLDDTIVTPIVTPGTDNPPFQVLLMPQPIYFTSQSEISHAFLPQDPSEHLFNLQPTDAEGQREGAPIPPLTSFAASAAGNKLTSESQVVRSSSQGNANDEDDIIEITIEGDEAEESAVHHKEPLKTSPKKTNLRKAPDWSDLNSQAHKVTIPFNGGSVVIQRFIFSTSLCRICLLEKEFLISIFDDMKISSEGTVENARGPNSSNRYNLASALKTLLDMEVALGDGLSTMICIDCIDSVMSFSAFKKRIGLGQARMAEVLAQVKNSTHPTIIPSLGENDITRAEIYRYSESIASAKKILASSVYSHLVIRQMPDKIWEKLFTAMVLMMGFKSAKLKELEQYVMGPPFVKAWFCKLCNLTFHGPQDAFIEHFLNSHEIQSAQEVKFPCDVCGHAFHKASVPGTDELYTEHWVQHFFFHRCDICDKNMPSLKGLWIHKKSAHVVSQMPPTNECDVCGKKFRRKTQLMAHKKIHLAPEERSKLMNKCPICEKNLTGSVSAHVASVHSEVRPWKCDMCSKCFKKKETLVGHRSTVHNTNKFQCDVCGIYLSSLAIKKTHEFRHRGVKPHKCDKCDQSFFDKPALKAHQLTHKEIADISCPHCEKTFKRQMYLTEHLRIHSEEKPFECPICQRRIRIRANYYKHLKVHKKNGTYDAAKIQAFQAATTNESNINAIAQGIS